MGCTLNFDDIKVPAANVVGEVGKGYKIAIEILNEGRLGIAGQMLGLAEGATTKAIRYAMDRHQFGKPVGSNQVMQHDFARVATELEAARLLLYNGARLKEEGKDFRREAAMAKWYAAQSPTRLVERRLSGVVESATLARPASKSTTETH